MSSRIVIAEDEAPLRADLIARLRQAWPDADLVGEAGDGVTALELIETTRPEVAFLDVRMPELSGLEVARELRGACHLVFVTAHEDAAVAAFEAGAVDYLLKPVRDERLAQTVERLKARLDQTPADVGRLLAQLMAATPQAPLRWVQASNGKAIEFVPVGEVAFFQADEKYTTVRTTERELLIRTSLKELLPQLEAARFWQIHRSTIVNVDFIERVVRLDDGDLEVRLKGVADALPVSRSYRFRFRYM